MSTPSMKERLAARMREQMAEMSAAMEERIAKLTDDDIPTVITYRPPLSPEEIVIGDRWRQMTLDDPLAIIPEARGLALGAARATGASKAKDEFEIAVEITAEVCAAKGIEPHNSKECADIVKPDVDAMMLKRKLKPVGVGRLKRALGRVAAERK
jgi:hypothetical protein